ATFIGTPIMNEFAGYEEDGYWQGENFCGYPVRPDMVPGTCITLDIRPANIWLASDVVPSVVDYVTPFFAERYKLVEVHLAGERWQMTVPLDEHIEVGSTIHCDLNPDGIMFFDSKTEQRVG